ncbi:MAG: GIY-YIG nuclease family protein [Thalassospira sp.]|jgi:putative endonuclease|nr:GIY-YIG nuclease family protein [Thalassospira sp.]
MTTGYTYILASKPHGTLYIGVTNDLIRRIYEHKNDMCAGFTKKYAVHNLVYYEIHTTITEAINAEKKLKKLPRARKIVIIERFNPPWQDLYNAII